MSRRARAVGAAPNVDMRHVDPATPFETDVDSHRVIEGYCAHCKLTETVLAEPGRTDEWTHATQHPDHMVIYELMEARR